MRKFIDEYVIDYACEVACVNVANVKSVTKCLPGGGGEGRGNKETFPADKYRGRFFAHVVKSCTCSSLDLNLAHQSFFFFFFGPNEQRSTCKCNRNPETRQQLCGAVWWYRVSVV